MHYKGTSRSSTLLAILLICLALAAGIWPGVSRVRPARAAGPSCTVGAGGATYATIQAAIDDTGCTTINVAAGTYAEHMTIGRSLTLNGAGAGSTIIDGSETDRVLMITGG
ncbi:MAG: hypothetical protein ACJ8CR_17420, partial [Roseiflexaceae bacterium]